MTGDRLLLGGVVTDGVHVTRGQHGTCRVSSIEIPHFYVSILGTRDGAFTVYVADTSRRDLLSVSCKPVLHATGSDVPKLERAVCRRSQHERIVGRKRDVQHSSKHARQIAGSDARVGVKHGDEIVLSRAGDGEPVVR